MPKNNHPAKYAITVARDEDRTYYFDDQDTFESFIRGLLVGEDASRDFATDFKVYQKAKDAWWEWQEQDFDPYDLFTDIDDTPYPLAHGQLLANYSSEIGHKILWNIAQGDEDAIALIPSDSLRARVKRTCQALCELSVWGEPESEVIDSDSDDTYMGNYLFKYGYEVRNDRKAARKLSLQLGNYIDEVDDAWLTEI